MGSRKNSVLCSCRCSGFYPLIGIQFFRVICLRVEDLLVGIISRSMFSVRHSYIKMIDQSYLTLLPVLLSFLIVSSLLQHSGCCPFSVLPRHCIASQLVSFLLRLFSFLLFFRS